MNSDPDFARSFYSGLLVFHYTGMSVCVYNLISLKQAQTHYLTGLCPGTGLAVLADWQGCVWRQGMCHWPINHPVLQTDWGFKGLLEKCEQMCVGVITMPPLMLTCQSVSLSFLQSVSSDPVHYMNGTTKLSDFMTQRLLYLTKVTVLMLHRKHWQPRKEIQSLDTE